MSGFDARAYVRNKYGNKEEEEVKELTSSETTSSDESDSFDPRAYTTEKYRKQAASEFGLDTLEADLQSMGTTISSLYSEWQSEETLANIKSSVEAIHGRLNQYQEYQKKYGGADLSDVVSGYQSVLDDWDNLSSYHGSYQNADAFNTARKKSQMDSEFSGLSYDEVQKKLKKYKEGSDEYKYLSEYTGYSDLRDFDKAIENLTDGDYKDKLQTERNKYALDNTFDLYKDYLEADDFEEKSQYVSTKSEGLWDKLTSQYGMGYEDLTYEYINNQDGIRDEITRKARAFGMDSGNTTSSMEKHGYDKLNEEEVAVYNTIYATEGKEAAQKFLDEMEVTLTKRTYDEETKRWEDAADSGAVASTLMSALSVPANITGAITGTLESVGDAISGKEYNPYGYYKTPSNFASDTREYVGENIAESTENLELFGQNIPSFLYQTGMSVADTAVGSQMFGKGFSVIMGLSSATQRAKELKEAGASETEVAVGAVASGAFEMVFEKLSLDNLIKVKNADSIGKIVKETLKQAGIEGSEEIATEVANILFDTAARGKESDAYKMYEEYIARGFTEDEAKARVAADLGGQIAWAGIGGALSGTAMGGVSTSAQYAENVGTGKGIRSNDRVQEMADLFDMMGLQGLTPEQSEAYKLYGEYTKKGDINSLSNAKMGNLYQTSEREAIDTLRSKKATNDQKADAAERLDKLGVIATSKSAEEKERQKRVEGLTKGEVTEINSTGNSVKIEGIRMEGDSTVVLTSEGEAKVEDMTFSSNDAEILSYAEVMGSEKGNLFISQYDGKQDVDAYRQSFNLAYAYGEAGIGSDTVLKNKGVLTESQVSEIYKNAVTIKANTKQKAIDAINEQYGSKLVAAGTFDDSVIDYNNATADGSKVNWKTLTSTQRRAITFAKAFSKAAGVNISFVKSEVVDGKHTGKNGSYNPNTNTIEIDVYAGRIDAKALNDSIIPTISHEITHWMKAKAPAMFSKMQETVMNTLASDVSMDDMINREMARMKNAHPDKNVTPEDAVDEIVARACEDMLSNSSKVRTLLLTLSESEKKTFIDKVKETYQSLMNWVEHLLGEYESGSEEAKILRAYEDKLREVSRMWDQALEEAIRTNQSLNEVGINGEALVNGISKDGTTIVGENNLQMSERTYRDGGREYLEKWLQKKVKSKFISKADADDILSQTDAMYQIMQDIKKNNKLPDYARWAETDITTDENGKKVSVIVKNGDYAMNLDIALVCKKRTALNAVLNALVQSNDLSVYTLTETDVAELNAIIKEHEFEIACALCFVDSKRYRVGSWADSFCEGSEDKNGKKYGFNEMVRSLVPKGSNIKIDEFNFTNRNIVNQPTKNLLKDADDSELDFTLIDKIMKDNPPAANGAKSAQYRYAEAIKNNKDLRSILNPSEIISSVGLDAIRVEHTALYGLINGHQGTAKPKFAHQAVAFANDILRATSWNASRAKMVGGVRLQSFSDFMANMVFDYVQMVSEMAAKKLPAHAYTKEPLFVKLFGLTGLKINMSLVPKVDLTAEQIERFKNMTDAQKEADPEYKRMKETAGLRINENGEAEYVWEDETFPYDVAMDIMADERYTKNCGTICVGISNAHIRKLLADDRISMVIPYHKSGLNHMVAEMRNIALYNDYTSVQNTRYASGEKLDTKKHKDFNFYGDLYGAGKKKGTHDPKQTAQNYLDWCEKHNYLPRFDEFKGDPNYYKLLIDFSVYDINDNMRYTEQEAVKAVYPAADEFKDLIVNGVQKNGVTYGGLKQSQGESTRLTNETRQIVDEFRNRLTEKYGQDVLGTQYSDRVVDKETLNFLSEQVSRGEYDAETNPNGGYYVTYKSMSFWGYDDDGNAILRSPMAEYVDGKLSDAYLLPKDKGKFNWYKATETIDKETGFPTGLLVKTKVPGKKSDVYLPASENKHLIKEDWSNLFFNLRKKIFENGKWKNSDVPARYNPYEHSSNSMLNDQFKAAYKRDNLVTVKMYVPVSEDNGAYRAKWSKDPTGWTDWKSGDVAGEIAKQKDLQRRLYLSRYAAPVEIVPDSEVAQAYKEYLDGTTVAVPDNVVPPNLLKELKKAGVKIKESGLVQYSDRDYSYQALISKPDMKMAELTSENISTKRSDIIEGALRNVAEVGFENEKGELYVHVDDIGTDVRVSRQSIIHGLDRRNIRFAPSMYKIGEILENSIRINEMTPKLETAKDSYVLIGCAKEGVDLHVVCFVVNRFTDEVEDLHLLYSANTKKESAAFLPKSAKYIAPPTDSTISIAQLLDVVKDHFPQILPEDVLRYYGYDRRPDGTLGESVLYSDREIDSWLADLSIEELMELLEDDDFDAAEPKKVARAERRKDEVNKRLKQLGLSFNGTKSLAWTDERIEKYLDGNHYGSSNPKYAQAYIAYVTPQQFLNLTAGGKTSTLDMIEEESEAYGEVDIKKLGDSVPLFLEINEGRVWSKVTGHEGRHRMYLLGKAGFEKVPVLLFDYRTKYEKTAKDEMKLIAQRFNDTDLISRSRNVVLNDVIPFSQGNKELIKQKFGSGTEADIHYSDRDGDLDSRTLLTNALSTVTQNDAEAELLTEYRNNIDIISIKESELAEITSQIKELSFGKGERDTKKLEYLKRRADKIRNSINYYDKKLLTLEAAGPLKAVVDRERAKARKNAYEKNREYTKKALSSYKERMEQRAKIQSITQKALTLNKWMVKNSKDEHIPEAVKPVVAKLLQAIDFSSKQLLGMSGENKWTPTKTDVSLAQALADVQKMMAAGEVDGEVLYELYGSDMEAEMNELVQAVNSYMRTVGDNAYVLNQMTLDELKTLDKVVGAIKASVAKMNKFHVVRHSNGIADLSQQTIVDLNRLGQAKLHGNKLVSNVSQMINWGNATPYYAFKRFGEGGVKVYEALMDGWDRFAFNTKKIIDYAEAAYTSDEVAEWSKEVKEFDGIDGKKIYMTVPQIMSLYCLQKREQAKGHILGGGIRVSDIKVKKDVISQSEGSVISKSLLEEITESLTDRQLAVADALQKFMNEDCADWGNEISMTRFGYKAFGEPNYFPIKSDENVTGDGEVKEKEKSLYRLLNMSFTKSVVKEANNRIVVDNIFDVFAQHTSEMAKYNALALPVLDAVRWFNYKEKGEKDKNGRFKTYSLKQSMEKAFGRDAKNYVNTFLEDINGTDNVGRDKVAKAFFTNAKIAAVGFNLKVAALQPTSYLRASAVIDPKYLANVSTPNEVKRGIEKAEKWCGMALWKSLGFYDTNIQRGVAELIKHEQSFKDKVTEASMKGAEVMDKITFGCLWNACEAEIKDTRKSLEVGSDAYYMAVGKRLREVIYATQVVDSTMTRSHMMRSNDTMDKMLTNFASEPTLSYNMLMDVFYDWKLAERKYGKGEGFKRYKGKMVRVATAYTVTNLVTSLLETAFEAYRDDDDEEEELADYVVSFLQSFGSNMGISTKIPYVKDLISIIQGFTSNRTDTQWMQDLMYAFKEWVKIFNGKGNVYKGVYRTLSIVSRLSGAALSNAMRDLASFWNVTIGSVYPSLKLYK